MEATRLRRAVLWAVSLDLLVAPALATPTGPDANLAAATSNPVATPAAPPPATRSATPVAVVAVDLSGEPAPDYVTPRYEPAGLPLIGGNSDIGFQFGAAGTLTRFEGDARPYAWNMDLVLDTSVKAGSGSGLQFAQQNYVWNWDIPDLADGRLRLNPIIYYQRTVDQGYFGLGDASSAARPPKSPARYFQYLDSELRARQLARWTLGHAYDLVLIGTFRAESPQVYPGTKLALDIAPATAPRGEPVRGVQEMGIGMIGGGIIYDTRDSEVFPHSGAFHQVGVKAVQGLPYDAGVQYGAFGADFSWFLPLFHRAIVAAARVVVDLEFGDVPFYDLFTGGPFQTYDMIGGPDGIRGVPSGRYLGRVKALGNVELRSLPLGFKLFKQSFRVGGDVFFDTGRTWIDYTFDNPLDGHGVGLKFGTGAGLYAEWGQAALFRIEVAYSPDQVAENPGFPVGVYVEEGTMF
jgi:outer membrane protein assembly factor BamA